MNSFNNLNLNKFTSFIEKAKQAVMCDSNCQKQKTADDLKQKYLASQTNLASAPAQVDTAKKNYVTFTQGELSYNTEKEQDLHKKAQIIIRTFNDTFNKESQQIKQEIETYNGLSINFKNVVDLYFKYKKENDDLNKNFKDNSSDVLTNERKTYYENQGIDSLNFVYNYILILIYVIFVIGYIFTSFLYNSYLNWKIRFVILLILLLLPFVSSWLLASIVSFIYKIYDLLPKNIHLSV
jgi:hypothetical protein